MLTIGKAMPGPSHEPHFHPFKLSQCCTKAMPEPTVEGEDIEPRLKLECVASWRLFGWVQVGPFPVTFEEISLPFFSHHLSLLDVHPQLNSTEHGQRPADWR